MILRRSGGLWPSVLLAAKGIVGPCAALVLALPTSASGQQTITDGDTLKQGGVIYRLWGIDSPEAKQVCPDCWPAGSLATTRLQALTAGKSIVCEEKDRDRYGRVAQRADGFLRVSGSPSILW